MKHITTLLAWLLLINLAATAQIDLKYQLPSQEILDLADVPLPPRTAFNDDASVIVLIYRNQYKKH